MQLQPEKTYTISGQAIQAIANQLLQLPRHTQAQCRAIESILAQSLVEKQEEQEEEDTL